MSCPASEPMEGWRSSIYMEMVDKDGKRRSDATINWYGGEGEEGRYMHNIIQTSLAKAVGGAVEEWVEARAEATGAKPAGMK